MITEALTNLLHAAGTPTDWIKYADVYHVPGLQETTIYWTWQGIEDRGGSWREHYTVDIEGEDLCSIENPEDFIDMFRDAAGEGTITRVEIGDEHLPMLMAGAIPIPV